MYEFLNKRSKGYSKNVQLTLKLDCVKNCLCVLAVLLTLAARITVVVSVCLSVRYPISHFTRHESLRKQYKVFSVGYIDRNLCRVFSETAAAFESYGVKHERKSMLVEQGPLPLTVYLEATRSHNEGRVSTPAWYLLL